VVSVRCVSLAAAIALALASPTPGRGATPLLVRAPHHEATASAGAWKGRLGLFPPYRPGVRVAVVFGVHNASGQAVQLLGLAPVPDGPAALRRVGVRLALAPPPARRDAFVSGLEAPYGALPAPAAVLIPPGRDAWVQLNFEIRRCAGGPPTPRTVNRRVVLRYRVAGERQARRTRLDLQSDQLTVAAPRCAS
jgi:hypothetical protein